MKNWSLFSSMRCVLLDHDVRSALLFVVAFTRRKPTIRSYPNMSSGDVGLFLA
jgi:hypothetical protein